MQDYALRRVVMVVIDNETHTIGYKLVNPGSDDALVWVCRKKTTPDWWEVLTPEGVLIDRYSSYTSGVLAAARWLRKKGVRVPV